MIKRPTNGLAWLCAVKTGKLYGSCGFCRLAIVPNILFHILYSIQWSAMTQITQITFKSILMTFKGCMTLLQAIYDVSVVCLWCACGACGFYHRHHLRTKNMFPGILNPAE
jgi:hypothetical protein